jgi:GDPmannose 4,6-dehydratase
MWLMLQQDQPNDFVLGTGVATTVERWGDLTFQKAGIDFREHFVHNKKYDRPAEVDSLLADSLKANTALKWRPSTSTEQLIDLMLAHDFELIANPNAIDEVTSELWKEVLA